LPLNDIESEQGVASHRTPRGTPIRKGGAKAKAAFFDQL